MTTVLHTENLRIGYKNRRQELVVADGINVSLGRGELVALIGPNGTGKSTLARTLAGMQPALNGHAYLLGEDVHRLKPAQLARRLSVVLTERPDVGLLSGYGLVALGRHPYTDWTGRLSEHDEWVIRWAVQAVGAEEIAYKPLVELSDGQRQKVMIARALAQEPELMILDEPTAYLDLPRRAEVMQLLKQLARECEETVVVSTHDLDLALRTADRVWLVSGGTLYDGTPEDLVLDGTFEAAFSGEGVTFDRASGSFRVQGERGMSVSLGGEGVPYIWTKRALEREGFVVTSNGGPSLARVDVQEADGTRTWHVAHDGAYTICRSIGRLVSLLRDEARAREGEA